MTADNFINVQSWTTEETERLVHALNESPLVEHAKLDVYDQNVEVTYDG